MSTDRTRVIYLDSDPLRRRGTNAGTVVAARAVAPEIPPCPFERLFIAQYSSIRRFVTEHLDPGIAVIAIDADSSCLAARMWIRARPGEINSAIIGRHNRADLYLASGPRLSLRHLALVVHPLEAWDESPPLTLLDLRTPSGFRDERGRLLEGVHADGPAFIACGGYALFFMPTGARALAPPRARDAWAALPVRHFDGARVAEPDRWRRRAVRPLGPRGARHDPSARSNMTAIGAPARLAEALVDPGARPLGTLSIVSEAGAQRLSLGAGALERGVLLGRYARCHGAGVLQNEAISRTHLLLVRVSEALYAIDTASTEGTFVELDGERFESRVARVDSGERILLGDARARLEWAWAQ